MKPQHILYICRPLGVPDHDRCQALASNYAAVTVLNLLENTSGYKWEISEARTYAVNDVEMQPGVLGRMKAHWAVVRKALKIRPDIAIVYDYQVPSFFLAATLLRWRRTFMLSMNDSKFDDYRRSIWKDLPKAMLLRPYHAILAATARAAEYATYLGKKNIGIYYCAINTDRVRRLSMPVHARTAFKDRYFIMLGRYMKKKNHLRLLDAYEQYAIGATAPRRLVLHGYGPLEDKIKARIAGSDMLSRYVDMRGFISSDKVPEVLGESLALLLPSTEEQFGIVVTEAMSSGIPVMLSQQCGACDIVEEGRNGFIVDPFNVDQMTRILGSIAQSEGIWAALSVEAVKSGAKADAGVFVHEVSRLYDAS